MMFMQEKRPEVIRETNLKNSVDINTHIGGLVSHMNFCTSWHLQASYLINIFGNYRNDRVKQTSTCDEPVLADQCLGTLKYIDFRKLRWYCKMYQMSGMK